MKLLHALAALAALPVLTTSVAAQDDPQFRGEYSDWRVFTRQTDSGQICYALSRPSDASPRSHEHGNVYFLVEKNSPLWREFSTAAAIGLHFAGNWPDLKLDLWAIMENRS